VLYGNTPPAFRSNAIAMLQNPKSALQNSITAAIGASLVVSVLRKYITKR